MEEKTEKIQIRTTQSSSTISSHDNDTSQSDHIPLDLTIEISSRLPAKSVVRFRSVSKLWSAITTSQDFISSFATRSLASRPSVLLTVKKREMLIFFSSPLHKSNFHGPLSCLGSYRFPKLKLHRYHYVHGLIFVEGSKQLMIWNPTVQRFFTLPAPEGIEYGYDRGWIVGYDSIEGKYIVLCVLRDSKICILTLGAQGQRSCSIITHSFPNHKPYTYTRPCGRCIDGVMYYGATDTVGGVRSERCLMSFDVRSKKLNKITYPEGLVSCYSCYMVPYEGRLAIVKTANFPSIDLWVLKNGNKHEWTHKRYVLPLSEKDPRRSQKFFCGVSDAGELIFGQGGLSQSFNILYFDPRRKSISREVSFDVGDEDRCRYGLGKDSWYNMNIYPNHIESLVSLL